jgi:hypothetical protein
LWRVQCSASIYWIDVRVTPIILINTQWKTKVKSYRESNHYYERSHYHNNYKLWTQLIILSLQINLSIYYILSRRNWAIPRKKFIRSVSQIPITRIDGSTKYIIGWYRKKWCLKNDPKYWSIRSHVNKYVL